MWVGMGGGWDEEGVGEGRRWVEIYKCIVCLFYLLN